MNSMLNKILNLKEQHTVSTAAAFKWIKHRAELYKIIDAVSDATDDQVKLSINEADCFCSILKFIILYYLEAVSMRLCLEGA